MNELSGSFILNGLWFDVTSQARQKKSFHFGIKNVPSAQNNQIHTSEAEAVPIDNEVLIIAAKL